MKPRNFAGKCPKCGHEETRTCSSTRPGWIETGWIVSPCSNPVQCPKIVRLDQIESER